VPKRVRQGRVTRLVAGIIGVIAGVLLIGAPAWAGSGTATPNSNLPSPATVVVTWTGMAANGAIYISQCDGSDPADPAWDSTINCSFLSQVQRAGTPTGTGSYNTFTVKLDPGADTFVCGPASGPTGTVQPDGRTLYNNCTIRVTDVSPDTRTREFFLPISFADQPGNQVPEAPFAILLPIGGIALIGGAYLILRGRKPALQA
jgi:hypothetical protein